MPCDGECPAVAAAGGGWTAAAKLRIMRDSRIGACGGLALGAARLCLRD